jgi:hypothetical protein
VSRRAEPRFNRKDDRYADHKEKRGKDQIGGRESVPRGVVHLRPCALAAGVVHHDHEGDGEAAQHVKRKQALGRPHQRRSGHRIRALPEFQPFVPPARNRPSSRFRALLLGSFFGIIFGAVTVYVGLRAGLTVAASIPIAVLSISILRAFGRASILENNIVQTTGNAGQSIASGVIFTCPRWSFSASISSTPASSCWPHRRLARRALHDSAAPPAHRAGARNLPYPEGTACADVLIAGEKGRLLASRVFLGLGWAALHLLPEREPLQSLAGHARVSARLRPAARAQRRIHQGRRHSEYLGVGYIIGPASPASSLPAASFLARAHAAHLLLRQGLPTRLSRPGPHRADGPQRALGHLHQAHGRGRRGRRRLITLIKTLPTIVSALTAGFKTMRPAQRPQAKPLRTEDDLSMRVVISARC